MNHDVARLAAALEANLEAHKTRWRFINWCVGTLCLVALVPLGVWLAVGIGALLR